MKERKTKDQLLQELSALREQVAQLKRSTSKHKQSDKSSKKDETIYKTAVDNSNDGIIVLSGDKRLYCNKKYLEILGFKNLEEIAEAPLYSFVHPDDRKIVMDHAGRRQQGEQAPTRYECRMIKKDGSIVHVEISASSIMYKGKPASFGFVRDITEYKETEKALSTNEETLRALIHATNETLFLIDTEGTILVANETLAKRVGKNVRELIGTCIYDYLGPKAGKTRKEKFDKVVRTGQPVHFEDARAGRSYDTFAYPVFDEKKKVSRVAVFGIDITERKKAEKELKDSETKYRTLFEYANDAIFLMSGDTFIDC
ncbi:MAG: PAS domain S-box protein, partial [Syntrophorhabdaceae bacterium]|nr:PAS domain S-box protein [Syntrophorhabdaceae bacterium]